MLLNNFFVLYPKASKINSFCDIVLLGFLCLTFERSFWLQACSVSHAMITWSLNLVPSLTNNLNPALSLTCFHFPTSFSLIYPQFLVSFISDTTTLSHSLHFTLSLPLSNHPPPTHALTYFCIKMRESALFLCLPARLRLPSVASLQDLVPSTSPPPSTTLGDKHCMA